MGPDRIFDLVGVGTAAADDLLTVERYPAADDKCRVQSSRRAFGGLVATALAAAARLGASASYAGALTDDELGRAVEGALERAGVDCGRTLRRPDGCTIHSVIVCETSRTTRTIFFSSPREYPAGVLDLAGIAASARVLVVDQLGLEAAREARLRGVPVVADMDWLERPDLDEFMAEVDHLIVSRRYAGAVTGAEEPARMVELLHASRPRACTAVTCGEAGCYYAAGGSGGVVHQPAVPVEAVETNGCGDVFHGAYAVALARGWSVDRSIVYASAAASVFASRPGGWEHLPTDAEALEALGRAGS